MNSLVSVLSTIIMMVMFGVAIRATNRAKESEDQNKILWGQVNHYEEYLKMRGAEDEDRQRMAIRN
jgi:hypothetical protein